MQVRIARDWDAAAIARIHVLTWRSAYRGQIPDAILDDLDVARRAAFWQERLTKGRGWVFVGEVGASIVGFCDLIPSRDEDANSERVGEIAAIYVLPEHWRKGAGRSLCARALADAKGQNYSCVTLWVLSSHSLSRAFYERMGFCLDGGTKIDKMSDVELLQVRYRIEF